LASDRNIGIISAGVIATLALVLTYTIFLNLSQSSFAKSHQISLVTPSSDDEDSTKQNKSTTLEGQGQIQGQALRCDKLKGPSSGLCQ
jgi:hypothetical protein